VSETAPRRREFGDGPLSKVASAIYTVLAVEALLLFAVAPGLVLVTLLDRDASNLPLVALAAVPLGPALSAALVTLRRPRFDLADLRPAAVFARAYRANAAAVLALWVPMLMVLTVVGVNLTHRDAAGIPVAWAGLLVAVATAALLWGLNALVIASFFTFRARDTARLAWSFLAWTPQVPLGTAGLVAAAAGVTLLWSEAVLTLLGAGFALLLLRTAAPMTVRVERDFTA
jgi:hypothetical protein